MEWILYGVATSIIVGGAFALYKRRRKTTLLKHDLSLGRTRQTESTRDGIRAEQVFTDAHRGAGSMPDDSGPQLWVTSARI
ncbi:hypothetical protein [Pseudoponticoccus marisrubri]|uniref:Uncharacterized protein n=1 Tax=Pseudoponticoccus marisrubri TaxID=1685382 RepID=A0A0W7WEV1_9RHOB|nr:hypothetical protein [Pseudoponticoccus marisrubri]KUF09028.1 hypothetical protein AVJ23_19725 [Pseudoponticoccus marisrubri]